MQHPKFPSHQHIETLERLGKKAVEGRTDVEFADSHEDLDPRNFGVGFCSPETPDDVKRFWVNKKEWTIFQRPHGAKSVCKKKSASSLKTTFHVNRHLL